MSFEGLTTVNIELSSKCNKNCWMCGRRKIERDYPKIKQNYGFMNFKILLKLARQIPKGLVIQFHNNGEPLMYPFLKEALELFPDNIKTLNTNGKLIDKKQKEVIDNLDTIVFSIIEEGYDEGFNQLLKITNFLKFKGNKKPRVIFRCLGEIDIFRTNEFENLAKQYGCLITKRMLHDPMGSYNYKKPPVIPEIGICLEVLNKMVIDKDGNVSYCVRFDPKKELVYGHVDHDILQLLWRGEKRTEFVKNHVKGKRHLNEVCKQCDYWGCPKG